MFWSRQQRIVLFVSLIFVIYTLVTSKMYLSCVRNVVCLSLWSFFAAPLWGSSTMSSDHKLASTVTLNSTDIIFNYSRHKYSLCRRHFNSHIYSLKNKVAVTLGLFLVRAERICYYVISFFSVSTFVRKTK